MNKFNSSNNLSFSINENASLLDQSTCSSTHDKDEKFLAVYDLDKRIYSYILHDYEDSSFLNQNKAQVEDEKNLFKTHKTVSWMEFYLRIFCDKNNRNVTREKVFRINFIINQNDKMNTNYKKEKLEFFKNLPTEFNSEESSKKTEEKSKKVNSSKNCFL